MSNITTVTHTASGSSCKVHSLGATVLSFISCDGREQLFVSENAVLDGSKAIRGGIPICFPIFGPPSISESTMPQHGFARLNHWTLVRAFDDSKSAGAVYELPLKDAIAGRGENNPWSVSSATLDGTDCTLTYEIRLEGFQLTSTLTVKNTGTAAFNFQMLLHTYYRVDQHAANDAKKTYVKGLGGYSIIDKVGDDSGAAQSFDDPVVILGEVDRVFVHPEDHPVVHVDVAVALTSEQTLRMEATGQVAEIVSPVSCVVWNPGAVKAAAMSDFGNEEYHDMICVEPGLLGHQPILNPSGEAILSQTIIVPHK
jgi:glucose-6-phosphate 1-epimerase